MQDNVVAEVYAAANEAEAYLVKNLLDNQGIPARVVNEPLYAVPCGVTVDPHVWVTKADADRALQIIEQWNAEQQDRGSGDRPCDWTCPHCGEKVPGQFEICWKCESPREE